MPRADRLFALVRLLAGPKRRRMDDLVRELGASARSIYRDLADLEARGIAIERVDGAYRLAAEIPLHPPPLVRDERLLLSILVANPVVSDQPHFRRALEGLRAKLIAAHGAGGRPGGALAGPDRSGAVPEEIAGEIGNAIAERRSVSILYASLSGGSARWRGIDPWTLIHRCEAWYLIGRCHVHDEPRTFRLDRIKGVLPIGTTFDAPPLDPDRWFANSWGVAASGAPREVVIVFDATLAPLIENARHHPNETKRRLEDGRIEYRARIGALDEIARWIVGFGGAAQAIAPPELAVAVRAIASGCADAHAKGRTAAVAMTRVAPSTRRRKNRSTDGN
jgi:predicted DNA-binding transcriptional regulator YafY